MTSWGERTPPREKSRWCRRLFASLASTTMDETNSRNCRTGTGEAGFLLRYLHATARRKPRPHENNKARPSQGDASAHSTIATRGSQRSLTTKCWLRTARIHVALSVAWGLTPLGSGPALARLPCQDANPAVSHPCGSRPTFEVKRTKSTTASAQQQRAHPGHRRLEQPPSARSGSSGSVCIWPQ